MGSATRAELAQGPGWAERVRRHLPGKLKEIPGDLIAPIAVATLVVVAIVFVQGGRFTARALAGTLAGALGLFLVSFFFGRWCGMRGWPTRGTRLAGALLTRIVRNERHDLVLTGRADFRPTTRRRVFEATALIASLETFAVAVLNVFLPPGAAFAIGFPLLLLTVYAGLFLVPHWVFARLGLRRFDKARFTIEPVTRVYSDRLKLSNGAIVFIVLGVGSFVLRQEGKTDLQAASELLSLLVTAVLFSLIAAASAVAFYQRAELQVMEQVARHALSLGARDGRGESHEELAAKLARERKRA